jgi:hypothetical protein
MAVLQINPQVLPWIAPVALALVFLLCFFSWNGAYPGGYGVYKQSAFQMIYGGGGHPADQVAVEKVFNTETKIDVDFNPLMILYILLILVALALAAAPLITAHTSYQLPTFAHTIWPWRSALAAAAVGLAFLILLLQTWRGFGLENAITKTIVGDEAKAGKTSGDTQRIADITQGAQLGRYNLRRTGWFDLAGFLNLVALAGACLEYWLEKRQHQGRPIPQVQIHW